MGERLRRSCQIHSSAKEMVRRAEERHGFPSRKAWAESFDDPPVSLSCLTNFSSGGATSKERFIAICESLDLDWQLVAFGPKESGFLQNSEELLESSETEAQDIPNADSGEEDTPTQQEPMGITNYSQKSVIITGQKAKVVTAESIGHVNL